ncbi:branched-chain amino acid transport system II carrier protein [Carnobacterium gallinarum]|uniref:branched-chain amino acid transport system II carrier protein n=1 Tax=Carnobacterium gallinarum TaxID=2749 RepID=UPI00055441B8|nr:branched-chain amino acid transport system II carrier protein [Carnobacterium gallinarum]
MDRRLSLSSYIFIGSMLFGLFFGAGNLIFPVHVGQEAGSNMLPATLGFLVTGIGLPFLGVVAIGISRSDGLYDLASRVHPIYGVCMTVLLYLTIGPFFALPRTGTVSYEIGIAPYLDSNYQKIGLLIFTLIFFLAALFFSMKPTKILIWVGKILNPMFLVFLAILIVTAFLKPMGAISDIAVESSYQAAPFIKGFTQGYNTMDALASLAFGIIVVQTIKGLGVNNPRNIAIDTIKSGVVSLILMAIIYGSLVYIGATSVGQFPVSENGGIALAQVAQYYFGSFGSILLAIIVTVACLKTAIGLITACSETFSEMFPNSVGYKTYVVIFTALACGVANLGLTTIISLSIPVLMFLYPLAITLIFLGLLSPLFKNRQIVYIMTTVFTIFVSFADGLNALPENIRTAPVSQTILNFYSHYLPLFDIGMGWVFPAIIGLALGWLISLFQKQELRF